MFLASESKSKAWAKYFLAARDEVQILPLSRQSCFRTSTDLLGACYATAATLEAVRAAREAFKPLSKSLIQYLNDHNVSGTYTEVYCPMAKASWLQKGDKIDNPYMEASMRGCGHIQTKAKTKTS